MFSGEMCVYIAVGVTDMHKAIDNLSIMVSEQLELDPLSWHLFAFSNRSRNILKGIIADLLVRHEKQIAILSEEIRLLCAQKFGRKTEKLVDLVDIKQLLLFDEAPTPAERAEEEEQETVIMVMCRLTAMAAMISSTTGRAWCMLAAGRMRVGNLPM